MVAEGLRVFPYCPCWLPQKARSLRFVRVDPGSRRAWFGGRARRGNHDNRIVRCRWLCILPVVGCLTGSTRFPSNNKHLGYCRGVCYCTPKGRQRGSGFCARVGTIHDHSHIYSISTRFQSLCPTCGAIVRRFVITLFTLHQTQRKPAATQRHTVWPEPMPFPAIGEQFPPAAVAHSANSPCTQPRAASRSRRLRPRVAAARTR